MSTHTHVAGPDCERYTDAIDELVDDAVDTLDTASRQRLEVHLAGCAPCRSLLADLRQIRALAGTLESTEPPVHVWHSLQRRAAADAYVPLGAVPPPSRWWRWSLGTAALAAAAGVVLAVIVPGGLVGPGPASVPPAADVSTGSTLGGATAASNLVEQPYLGTIGALQQLVAADQPGLTPVTATLTRSLAMVDNAIAESRAAVAAEPYNTVAQSHLRAGLRRKVTLLQAVVTAAGTSG